MFCFFTSKGYWLRENKYKFLKIPLVARSCKEDSKEEGLSWSSSQAIALPIHLESYTDGDGRHWSDRQGQTASVNSSSWCFQ